MPRKSKITVAVIEYIEETNVIVDRENEKLDRVMPIKEAEKRYREGDLSFSYISKQFCTHQNGFCPAWLTKYPKVK